MSPELKIAGMTLTDRPLTLPSDSITVKDTEPFTEGKISFPAVDPADGVTKTFYRWDQGRIDIDEKHLDIYLKPNGSNGIHRNNINLTLVETYLEVRK